MTVARGNPVHIMILFEGCYGKPNDVTFCLLYWVIDPVWSLNPSTFRPRCFCRYWCGVIFDIIPHFICSCHSIELCKTSTVVLCDSKYTMHTVGKRRGRGIRRRSITRETQWCQLGGGASSIRGISIWYTSPCSVCHSSKTHGFRCLRIVRFHQQINIIRRTGAKWKGLFLS